MIWLVIALLLVVIVMLSGILWVLTNIRSDQLIIRTFIAHELREKRGKYNVYDDAGNFVARVPKSGVPTDDAGFFKYLRDHPDRPHKDDPPSGRPTSP